MREEENLRKLMEISGCWKIEGKNRILIGFTLLVCFLILIYLKEVPGNILVGTCFSKRYNNVEGIEDIRFSSISSIINFNSE